MMKVSTRGRYALRLMIDLAHHRNEGYVSLKEISARIHHGRNPETDGRLPSAYFLHGSPRKSVPAGGRMRHAAFLARASASH